MYSEQLETLIKNVLADGVITEKERAVLHKCAEAEGVDPDEIDVYIDGELDRIYNERQKAKAQVRKCPACGEIIPVLSNICPSCGSAVQDDNVKILITKMVDDLQKIKNISFKNKGEYFSAESIANCEKDIRTAKILYGENRKISQLIIELQSELDSAKASFTKWKKFQHLRWLKSLIILLFLFVYFVYYIHIYGIEDLYLARFILYGLGVLFISYSLARLIVLAIKYLNIGDRN